MMIGIKIKEVYLDLPSGASTQTERNSPLLATDEILGEFNYPQNIPATEHNMRTLGFITELGAVKTGKIRITDAAYEEHNLLLYRGTLVAEYVDADLNSPERGQISVYFLTAISSFFSQARNVMLSQLDLGGERTIYDFPAHAKSTWMGSSDTFDYVFAPIKNNQYFPTGEDPAPDELDRFMNPIWDIGHGIELNTIAGENSVMPFIYYKFLLLRCFTHFGYTVSGDILDDPDFKRAYFLNFNAIRWAAWTLALLPEPINPVGIDLARHVPRDYSVTKFLLNVGNLFGVGYRFNTTARHCQLIQLQQFSQSAQRKDMTAMADARIKMTFRKELPVYALKLNFDPADSKAAKPDLGGLTFYGVVNTVDDLPPATMALDDHYALLKFTNWYYVCRYDEDLEDYMWNYLADNIYDYEPEGNNQTIETSITPVSQSLARWRGGGGGSFHFALMPEVRQEGNWPGKVGDFTNWEMRILFYHGLRPDNSGKDYPFSSSHNYTFQGAKVAEYSLTLNPPDGIISKFWSAWFKLLSGLEEVELLLYLNLAQYRQLDWTDIILIRSTPFMITQLTPQSPYDDRCPCKAIRLDLGTSTAGEPTCVAAVGGVNAVDNNDGSATVTFVEAAPGASGWIASVDGGPSFAVAGSPFPVFGLPAGVHTITVTPLCSGTPRPEGAGTANFEIAAWEVTMTLSAQLTTGRGSNNKLQLTITMNRLPTTPINFKFGQCVLNTSSGIPYCLGFPGSTNPGVNTPVTVQYSTVLTVESTAVTPGADFGNILKIVLYDIAGIATANISKAAGQAWTLELQ